MVMMWHGTLAVDRVDHRREARRLARSGGTGDEHEALRQVDEVLDDLRKPQVVERRDPVGDQPQRDRRHAALVERVDAEPAALVPSEREVDLFLGVELLEELGAQERRHDGLGVLLVERRHVDRHEDAVDPEQRRAPDRQEEVGRVAVPQLGEVIRDRAAAIPPHRRSRASDPERLPTLACRVATTAGSWSGCLQGWRRWRRR